ncbi:hypothetical protein IFM89_004956 [Coptis chinensis]|uniref:Uncharacterized protein n=1 Tax=Coptis chinensis TaxID=261450 RepID=A0A835HNR8_9MAGN|nr:hypothetical protein IFM89_004956 [Coptis chinensis]
MPQFCRLCFLIGNSQVGIVMICIY